MRIAIHQPGVASVCVANEGPMKGHYWAKQNVANAGPIMGHLTSQCWSNVECHHWTNAVQPTVGQYWVSLGMLVACQ